MTSDYTTSSNPRFLYFAELHQPFPDWVASSGIPKFENFEKCASTAFADQARRLLPIRDKISTFHSALDLFANSDSYGDEAFARIKNACDFHGISDEVAPYAEVFATKIEKQAYESAPAVGRFAIDENIGGVSYSLLPLNDEHDVRESAHELSKMAADRRIHFVTLFPAAQAVVKAAAEFGVEGIPTLVLRLGIPRCPNFDKAASLIEGREKLAKDTSIREGVCLSYAEAIAEARETGDANQCVIKIAAIDDAAGINYGYNTASLVVLPSDIVFCGPLVSEVEKAAVANVAVGDILIPLDEFQKLDLDRSDFLLSKEAAHSLRSTIDTQDAKDVSIAVMSWCDDDRRTLLRMASQL